MLTVSLDDFLWFVDDCLDAMLSILHDLGDDLANESLDPPGSNSPYAILTHCLGVVEWWSGEMVAGVPVERDRDAEFTAHGPVAPMADAVRRTRARLVENLTHLDATASTARPPRADVVDLPYGRTQGAVLVHLFHELAQHRGQMEVTRDVLRAPAATARP